jgi:nicotinamidase-related amidase
MKSENNKYYKVCCVLLGMSFLLQCLSAADKCAGEASSAKEIEIPVRYGTYANDDCRFFSERSLKVTRTEKGEVDDWMGITCKGVREYIHGINPRRCALVIVDLEGGNKENGFFRLCPALGQKFDDRMNNIVIPNVSRLLDLFRRNDMPVIYTTLGDDSFREGIKPSKKRLDEKKEFVVRKYSDGAFPTSPIDNILREHGIATVFFAGQDTACCVNATINEAQDRSYQCILIEDGCVASRSELHEATVKIWAYRAFVRTTDQVINDYPWQKWVYPDDSNSK